MKKFVLISGGKDSTATLFKVLEIEKDIEGLFCDTGWEHSLTYQYIDELEKFTGIKINKIKNEKWNMLSIIDKYLPNDRFRTCNTYLKREVTKKFLRQFKPEYIILYSGIRLNESQSRSKRYKGLNSVDFYENRYYSIKSQKVYDNYPILNWTEEKVFEYIKQKGFYVNPLYDMGFKRVGCFPCICSSKEELMLCKKDSIGQKNIQAICNILKTKNKDILLKEAKNLYNILKSCKND